MCRSVVRASRNDVSDGDEVMKVSAARNPATIQSCNSLPLWLQLQLDRSIAKHLEKGLWW